MRLNLKSVEERVKPLGGRRIYEREFIFDLLAAYGRSASSVTRLRSGSLNVAEHPESEVAQKNVVYFQATKGDLYTAIDRLQSAPSVVRFSCRFVIATDYTDLLAVDTKTGETLASAITDIDKHFTFFLPWAGMEKAQYVGEKHADVKAAEKMAKLFDELVVLNPGIRDTRQAQHSLNVFFTRLLFCFFAEDTGIFSENLFTHSVKSLTQPDGSDLAGFLKNVFDALDTANPNSKPSHLQRFPYVNGRLFTVQAHHTVPAFNKKARDYLTELGDLQWSEINPDIFGSMFQAVVTPGQRSNLGQHYTSVPNILKTIEPLFLDALKDEFNAAFDKPKKLEALLDRIAEIKVFDPACGSGNFLVIAYKEMRKLEHAILERLQEPSMRAGKAQLAMGAQSRINVEHFFGIEIDDFAAEVAVLSLWIAKHQMNMDFLDKFGIDVPLIPLKESGQITVANAITSDWNAVCPNRRLEEIYLVSNPPYLGSRNQNSTQKADLRSVTPNYKSLDYVSAWFIKGANYIRGTRAELAFVSTNSITQGEQVGVLWPSTLQDDLEIGYAHRSFRWSNQARGAAGVTCVVVSLRARGSRPIFLVDDGIQQQVASINGYLTDGPAVQIGRRSAPLSGNLPRLIYGSMPNDGGNLILSTTERDELLREAPAARKFIKAFVGADEFIKSKSRWCLVISDDELTTAQSIPAIAKRLDGVANHRAKSTEKSTRELAKFPNRFYFFGYKPTDSILVPLHSSERREYIPFGYLGKDTVISNAASVIYDAEPWVFALLTSRMHMAWTKAVGGQLETRLRYSGTLIYNNFPVANLTAKETEALNDAAFRVLDVREYFSGKTLADLYDPDEMPDELRGAHNDIDKLVDRLYRKSGFDTDEERLSYLFGMYEQMTAAEGSKR